MGQLHGTPIEIHFPQYDLGKLTGDEKEQLIEAVEAKVRAAKETWGATGVAGVEGVLPHIDRLRIS